MRLLDYAASAPWAILPERAPELAAIADRAHLADPKALEAYRSQALERSDRAGIRGGVAILNVEGPLFKKANLFVNLSGATSYQILARDLQTALDDPKVNSILLIVDSPGGEANGCDELAATIFAARSLKPITAYVSGMAASGGYWIASAASRVVVSEAALLGSIGVVLGVQDKSAADERRGVKNIEFVSSQSPGKRPDPTTDAGRSRIQTMVDDLAAVFISSVARHRSVSSDTVIKKFGGGGMLVGKAAVAAGMADEVGQLEPVIASMQRSRSPNTRPSITSHAPTLSSPVKVEDVAGRIKAIVTSENAKVLPTLTNALAFDSDHSAELCLAILTAAKDDYEKHIAAIATTGQPAPPAISYFEHKRRAGALGTEMHVPSEDRAAARATWQSAVDAANGDIAHVPPLVRTLKFEV